MSTQKRFGHTMSRLGRSWMVLFVVVGLLVGAGIASAAEGDPAEEPAEDTLLNFGYDAENHVFLVNTSATDSTYDCTLEDGILTAEYGTTNNHRVPVNMLLDEDRQAFLFPNRPIDQVGSDFTPAADPVAYAGAEGECGISGGVVAGPNGQINHGQFMKLFHQLVDMRGRGCLNRIIAQSDLGKGDQQLRTSDVDPAFEPGATGQVDFTTAAADCNHHKKDNDANHEASSQGKKDKNQQSGRPDSPGNSGSAPGKNK